MVILDFGGKSRGGAAGGRGWGVCRENPGPLMLGPALGDRQMAEVKKGYDFKFIGVRGEPRRTGTDNGVRRGPVTGFPNLRSVRSDHVPIQ